MQTKILKIDAAKPEKSAILEAAKIIDTGGLVAFPTETVYGIACRVADDSLKRLNSVKGRTAQKYYTLHLSQPDEINKYVPKPGLRAQKLIKNALPGPLTIVFEVDKEDLDKVKNKLRREVYENLYRNNSIGIRCPDNIIAKQLLINIKSAVVAPSANPANQAPGVSAEQVLDNLNGQIDMIIDGGTSKYGESSTVVKIGKKGLNILREGAYNKNKLQEMYTVSILFVCTGNTCRSPMAEGIFKKRLSEKLQCNIDQLEEIGYKVSSAGTIGVGGWPVSAEAVNACKLHSINIGSHISTALTKELISDADLIYVMGQCHRIGVLEMCEGSADKCFLLNGDADIFDPIGQSQDIYNNCFDLIDRAITKRISELEL